MGVIHLRQSTAVTLKLGPLVDPTDPSARVEGLTLTAGEVYISKGTSGAFAAKNDSNDPVEDANGYYDYQLDATDTGTLGVLTVDLIEAGTAAIAFLAIKPEYVVIDPVVWDALYGANGTDYLQVDVVQSAGATAPTVSDIADAVVSDGNPINATSGVIDHVTLVDTTTTNTDMRGTDSAFLAASAPTNFSDMSITASTGLVSLAADQSGVTIGTVTTNTDMRGTDNAATAAKMLAYFQLTLRSDAAIASDLSTELGEINADEGSGAGDYDSTSSSQEAGGSGADMDKILGYFQLTLRNDSAIASDRSTELGEINANEGSGAGDYTPTIQAQELISTIYSDATSNFATILTRLSSARAGYLDNLNGHTPQTGDSYAQLATDMDTLLGYFQLIARVDSGIATDRSTELAAINNDEGSGAGSYDNTTDSIQGNYDTLETHDIALTSYSNTITGYVDSLETRLTAARAGYLDNLNGHVAQTGDTYAELPSNFGDLSITVTNGYVTVGTDATTVAEYWFTLSLSRDTNDEYTAVWYYRNTPITSGATSPTIQVIKRADGTDLVAQTAMSFVVDETGYVKYDEGTNKLSAKEGVIVVMTITHGGSERTWAVAWQETQ